MRALSIYGLIGAIFGLWSVLVLMAVALPDYDSYLMPLEMYRDVTATAGLANLFGDLTSWLPWSALVVGVGLWYLVAGRLHPALVQPQRADKKQRLRTWAAWFGGGALFVLACMLVLSSTNLGMIGVGGRIDLMTAIVAILASALVWAVVSPQAFGRFGKKRLSKLKWPAVARTAGLGVLFFLMFGLVVRIVGVAYTTWFTVVVEALDRSTEPSLFGWTWLTIGAVVLAALSSAVIFGLLPAFVPGTGDWRKRIDAVRPALILAGGMLVAGAVALPLLHGIDLLGQKKLTDVAALSGVQPLSLRLVKFCGDSNCRAGKLPQARPALKVGKPITQVSASGLFYDGGDVPLHPDTVTALERYVAGDGKRSVLRKSAMMGAADVHRSLWQPLEYYRQIDRFTEQGDMKHGSLLQIQIKLAWLQRAAPINAETRAMLEQLSEDKRYFIGSRAAARLAAAWARFGDMKRAEEFLARARKAKPGRYDAMSLTASGLSNGRVTGRIALPGATPAGIRVGLFRVTEDELAKSGTSASKGKPPRVVKPAFTRTGVTALSGSAVLTADGRFAFQNLSAGEYYLAALVPDEALKGAERVVGINAPDLIGLNARAPRRDLGTIRLTAQN